MQNKVQIIPDDLGNVIRVSQNNTDYGHVRLQQERVTFGNTGWVNRKTISTLLHGKVEDLRDMGLHNMKELAGKIVIRESLEPFNTNDPDRDLKIAGDTGIVCCQDGQPIYRKTVFTADTNAEDVLVAHDNGDAIREANGNRTFSAPKVNLDNIRFEEDPVDDTEEVSVDETEEVILEDDDNSFIL